MFPSVVTYLLRHETARFHRAVSENVNHVQLERRGDGSLYIFRPFALCTEEFHTVQLKMRILRVNSNGWGCSPFKATAYRWIERLKVFNHLPDHCCRKRSRTGSRSAWRRRGSKVTWYRDVEHASPAHYASCAPRSSVPRNRSWSGSVRWAHAVHEAVTLYRNSRRTGSAPT